MIGARIGIVVGAALGPACGIGVDQLAPGPTSGNNLVIIIGDSNCVGIAYAISAETGLQLETPYPAVNLYSRMAFNPGNPFTNFPTAALQPYTHVDDPRMGAELTFGRELYENGGYEPFVGKLGMSGSTTEDWAQPAFLADLVDFIHDMETESGARLGAVVVSLGANDANDTEPVADAYQANLTTVITAIRGAFGSTIPVALHQLPLATVAPYVAEVRAGATAYVAADPLSTLVKTDDLPMADDFHFTADGYATLGQRAANAVITLLELDRYAPTGIPALVGTAPAVKGASTLTPPSPGISADGDLEILVVNTSAANAAITLSDAQGFAAIASGEQQCVWLGSFYDNIKLYTRPVSQATLNANFGTMPAPTIADSNATNGAKIYVVRGPSGTPTVHRVGGAVNNTNGTTLNLTSFTTANANALILNVIGGLSSTADNAATVVNAAIAGIETDAVSMLAVAEKNFIVLSKGTKAAAGAVGTSVVTMTGASMLAGVSLAVTP